MSFNFFHSYFKYVGETEAPNLYHRWTATSIVAALLGRNIYFPFGHSCIYPNMYIMLEGSPGTRKGTALRPARNLLKAIEFKKLAPDRLSAERFIIEMEELNKEEDLDGILFETLNFETPAEIYVMAGEFQDFIGQANLNFIGLLTNLWDNLPEYKHPKIHGQSVFVNQPTVNLIAAANQQSLQISLPVEAIGQGLTSRVIFVHAEPTGRKITFPKPVNKDLMGELCDKLREIQGLKGEVRISKSAEHLLDRVYKEFVSIDDFRFHHYNTRRFDHIIKLCIAFAAMDCRLEISEQHVLQANTLLYVTEQRMPRALGEFGKAKNADVANNILEYLKSTFPHPQGLKDIWKKTSNDLSKIDDLMDILRGMEQAEKIQIKEVAGKRGYIPLLKLTNHWADELLLKDFLTKEEMI